MSTPNPPTPPAAPANLEQQHKLAKDLIEAARTGDAAAVARIRAARSDAGESSRPLALADAQLAIAREAGFPSWPKLVADFQERDVKAFCEAVRAKDVPRTQQLVALDHVRARINDPMFDFGQRAAHAAAKNVTLLEVLIGAGADVNLRSDWQKRPLHRARQHRRGHGAMAPGTGRDADAERRGATRLARGSAAPRRRRSRAGARARRRRPAAAARGEDGRHRRLAARPRRRNRRALHRSQVHAGAVRARRSARRLPAAARARRDARHLHGRPPRDVALATRLLDADPDCAGARINEPGYAAVPPFNIYCWSLGFGLSPHAVATRFGHEDVHALLASRSPARVRFLDALLAADEPAAKAVIAEDPSLMPSLTRHEHGHLAHAIFHELFDAADLMLRLGFDPSGPGIDGGTALHAACWVGSVRMVDRLLAHGGVPLDARDPRTEHAARLAAFGSVHRCAPGADYPAVAERLVAAGADITARGQRRRHDLAGDGEGERDDAGGAAPARRDVATQAGAVSRRR